jgi:hypothetical protein
MREHGVRMREHGVRSDGVQERLELWYALRNAVAARDSCVRLHMAELKFVRCSSFETHACKVCHYEIHTHEMHIREMYTREIYVHRSAAFLGRCRCGKGVPPNQTDLRYLRSPATTVDSLHQTEATRATRASFSL